MSLSIPERLRDPAWATGIKLLSLLIAFLLNVVLARMLPPATLGIWFVIITVAGVVGAISEFGVPDLLVRLIAEHRSDHRLLTRGLLVVLVSLSFFVSLSLLPLGDRIAEGLMGDAAPYFFLSVAIGGARALERIGAEALRGQGNLPGAVLGDQSTSRALFLGAIAGAYVIGITLRPIGLAVALIAATVVAFGMSVAWFYAGGSSSDRARGSLAPRPRQLAINGSPLLLQRLSGLLISNGDLIIVGALLGSLDVADYGLALRIAGLLAIPLGIVTAIVPHRVASLTIQNQRSELQRAITHASRAAGLASISGLLVLAVGGEFILGLIFGSQYQGAYAPMVLLGAGQVANAVSGPATHVLMHAGHRRLAAINSATFAVIMLSTCSIAATSSNPIWVACAASLSMALEGIVAWHLVKSHVGIRTDCLVRLSVRTH